MLLLRDSCTNTSHKSFSFQWVGIVFTTISAIRFTTQSPTQVARRTDAPVTRPKPVMGWNSFYPFGCEGINAKKLKWQADLMAEKGFIKAGYTTFVIECGWEADTNPGQSALGLTYFGGVFGHHLHDFIDDFTRRGLKLGYGTWGGPQMCPRNAKEAFHVDGRSNFDEWVSDLQIIGATYLSHRPCDLASPQVLQTDRAIELNSRYTQMEGSIKNRGFQDKIIYATGQWGATPSARDTKANSWRIADDTLDNWNSFIRTLNALFPYSLANKGPYNDLGFLQLGQNKLTLAEKRTQFSFWAAAKSPLIFSTDISQLPPDDIQMITNPQAIAINQDNLGQSITLKHRYPADVDIWSGPLSDGSTVAVIVNWSDGLSSEKKILLADLGFESAHIYDVNTGKDFGMVSKILTATVEKHGCLLLKLTQTTPSPPRKFTRFPVDQAEILGAAIMKRTSQGVKVAGDLKPDGKSGVRWNNIPGSRNGNTLVSFDYINADLSPGNMDDSKLNFKRAAIIINDGPKFYMDFPITGLTWDDMVPGFLVSLPLKPGSNTIIIQADRDSAPDFHCLSVEQTY